jgi:hypothetical protein
MFLSRSRLSMVAISAVLSIFATLAVSTNAQATGRPPKKVAQATLTFAADRIAVVGGSLTLTSSGGSGTGYITYKLAAENSACHIRGNILRTYIATTCWVYAVKSADTQFLVARSQSVQFIFRLPQNAFYGAMRSGHHQQIADGCRFYEYIHCTNAIIAVGK